MKKLILIFTSIILLAMFAVVPAMWHVPNINLQKNLFNDSFLKSFDWKKQNDTSFVKKTFKDTASIREKKVSTPIHTVVYEPDTSTRKQLETGSIITKVSLFNPLFKPKRIVIDKIDTKGIVYESVYKIPVLATYVIDHNGNIRIRKRLFLKIALATASIIAIITAVKLIKDNTTQSEN